MNAHPEVTGRAPLQRFAAPAVTDDCVMSFDEWCKLNGFSRSTGQRLIAAGKGPQFIRLSERRKGVTVAENRRWQASRLIETAA
ncbi:MAG: transcriptional regulator [Bradyrhizobium sp.]